MGNSIISAIEDLIDELEDSAYNREDSYKINWHRDKISFALNNILTTDQIELKKVYRFEFNSSITGNTLHSPFYKNEFDAYDRLDDFKEDVRVDHEEWDMYELGDTIELQEINLHDVEGIDYYAKTSVVSEIVPDEDASEERRLELLECCGIFLSPDDYQVVCWEDK